MVLPKLYSINLKLGLVFRMLIREFGRFSNHAVFNHLAQAFHRIIGTRTCHNSVQASNLYLSQIFAPPPYPPPGFSGSIQGTSSVAPAPPKPEGSYMGSESRSIAKPQTLHESSSFDWPMGSVRREVVKGEEDHKWKHNKWVWRSTGTVQHEGHAVEQRICLGVFRCEGCGRLKVPQNPGCFTPETAGKWGQTNRITVTASGSAYGYGTSLDRANAPPRLRTFTLASPDSLLILARRFWSWLPPFALFAQTRLSAHQSTYWLVSCSFGRIPSYTISGPTSAPGWLYRRLVIK
ncbi:hypothetical protein B0H13DRAFT_1857402 [Mycena leptocephala]|nr:hypothetical protein B0H13DRAFT_1857402 [Mycena leptocephala]